MRMHDIVEAVKANLIAAGLPVGDGEKPAGAGWQRTKLANPS